MQGAFYKLIRRHYYRVENSKGDLVFHPVYYGSMDAFGLSNEFQNFTETLLF